MLLTPSYRRGKYLLLLCATVAAILSLTGCQQQAPPAPDTRAADETAIRAACDDFMKAVVAMDAAKAASFYTDDAVTMWPDAPPVQGKENTQKYFEGMFQTKPENVTFNVAKVEVAKSGDVAYEWGTGKLTVKDKKGKATEMTYKSLTAWMKQADGTWKITVDTEIPDLLPPKK
jgi:uncharacterized protein (TIGR02246 family)